MNCTQDADAAYASTYFQDPMSLGLCKDEVKFFALQTITILRTTVAGDYSARMPFPV